MPKGINITPEQKELIVATYKTGLTYAQVAEKLGLSKCAVGKAVRESGYDRFHVGSTIAKSIPVPFEKPLEKPAGNPFRITARTLKLHSDATGHSYTVSTESDVVDIESDNALMQLPASAIDAFISELQRIKTMLGNPS